MVPYEYRSTKDGSPKHEILGSERHGRDCERSLSGYGKDPFVTLEGVLDTPADIMPLGVDAVFGEIMTTLAKIDW
jgi:hypothetical protein